MKTLLFILLASISCIAQPFNYRGKYFNATVYPSAIPSHSYVVCYPGSGEAYGPADGSRLLLASKNGYPRYAKAGKQFPFNVVAVQAISSTPSYNPAMEPELFAWLDQLGALKIGLVGWSLGGKEVADLMLKFKGRQLTSKVVALVDIDGNQSGDPDYLNASDVPTILIIGSNGMFMVAFKKMITFLKQYNRINQPKYIEIPNADHNGAMEKAYNTDDPNGKVVFDFLCEHLVEPVKKKAVKVDSISVINDSTAVIYYGGKEAHIFFK